MKHQVCYIGRCFVKPKYVPEASKKLYHLTPWDLAMLSSDYIQEGLLFAKPPVFHDRDDNMETLLCKLKDSLSLTLVHFFQLAGRLAIIKEENPASQAIFLDCRNSPGAEFIHAVADASVSDILSPTHVPEVVRSFFDLNQAVNYDGHTKPLVSVQVTELVDGVFIGCSMNHAVADGTSFWHFFNTWSELYKAERGHYAVSRPPTSMRWFPDGWSSIVKLPFAHQDEFIIKYEPPPLRERIFHFSSDSIAKLKAKANAECNTHKISSFQALTAHVWRAITRARKLPQDQMTMCRIPITNRSRLEPPLSQDYFGNSLQAVVEVIMVGELLQNNLGWAARILHEAVVSHNDKVIRASLDKWTKLPTIYQLGCLSGTCAVMMGNSPRFDVYGNEFGLGKAIAARSGSGNKFDGKVTSYPGSEGGGIVDLGICLSPDSVKILEADLEFMEAVSS